MVGWCDGPGETSSAGASYNLDIVGQGPIVLAVGAGGGCLDSFTLLYLFSSLCPSLWEPARYRLKYCLKGPLNPKQPTNQIFSSGVFCSNIWEFFCFKYFFSAYSVTLFSSVYLKSSNLSVFRFAS